MLKFLVRIGIFAMVLALVVPALKLGAYAGGIWPALGLAAVCALLAGIANTVLGMVGVAVLGAVGRSVLAYRLADILVNWVGAVLVYMGALKLTMLLLGQYLTLAGLGSLAITAIVLSIVGHYCGDRPMTVTINVTRSVTTTTTTSFRERRR